MDRFGRSTGDGIVIAQHDDAALVLLAPQPLGGGKAGRTAADDDDFLGRFARRFAAQLRCRLVALLSHEDLAVALLDRPAGDRAQGRSAQGFARAQVEAGVMPGTAHGVADHEPVDERTVVMRAIGPDREHLRPAAHQQNLLVADMADQLAAIGKRAERNALRQIGAAGLGLVLSHSLSPLAI